MIITADEAVREAVMCVFRRFDQLGSARQVVVSLRADGLRLPRRDIRTGKIIWAQAGYPAVHDILTHPGYAGAFAYGRSKTEKHLNAEGKVITRQRRLPRDQWAVMIPGHHPGYISLETYDANVARLAASSPQQAGGAGGAAREGAAWLQGLLRCGRCGRLMQVACHAGGSPAYRCGRANQMYGARICQRIGGRRLHETVLAELLAALAPACLAATAQALADTEAQFRQNLAVSGDGTARTSQVQITWQGGASTALQMPMPASGRHGRTTSEDTINPDHDQEVAAYVEGEISAAELYRRTVARYRQP
ncbi:MAG: recombinase family protein [Streptosporangiaceae bacterium]